MNNLDRYRQTLAEALELELPDYDGLGYGKTNGWDSVGHMELVAALEDAFGIMLEPEDIFSLTSYARGIDILRKYGVEV